MGIKEKFENSFKGYHKDAPAHLKNESKKLVAKKMPAKKERGINDARLGRKPKGWYTDSRSDFEKKLEKAKDYM